MIHLLLLLYFIVVIVQLEKNASSHLSLGGVGVLFLVGVNRQTVVLSLFVFETTSGAEVYFKGPTCLKCRHEKLRLVSSQESVE